MRCAVVRFVAHEDLGLWAAPVRARGYDIDYLDAATDELSPVADADLVIVLGGPIDADDVEGHPEVGEVRAVLGRRVLAGEPTLAICLGAQIMSLALGAEVHRGRREMGWGPVTLTEAALATPLRHVEGVSVAHWHNDEFTLPPGATRLASTQGCPNQAYSYGRSLAIQFHPEYDPVEVDRLVADNVVDVAQWGVDPEALRAETRAAAAGATRASLRLIDEYLSAL